MYTYLIVDDELIERKGLCMLLKRVDKNGTILQAANGEDALAVLEENQVDVLMTDINMPFMDGMGLLEQVHKKYPEMPSIIFSGYDDFSYAKKAISYGVSEYILKPVNPEEFEKAVRNILAELEQSRQEERRKDESIDFIKEHLLYLMVNGQSKASLQEKAMDLIDLNFVDGYQRMLLLECNGNFFEQMDETILKGMRKVLGISFQYLNLNPEQALLFFTEEPTKEWATVGEQLVAYFLLECGQTCFVSVSADMQTYPMEITEHFALVEKQMEEKFYAVDKHVFLPFQQQETYEDTQEDAERLIGQIQLDIKHRDMENLQEHFQLFCDRYQFQKNFSQIYIKFMFSNLLKEIYSHLTDTDEKLLNRAIDRLYHCNDMQSMIVILQTSIDKLQLQMENSCGTKRREVEMVQQIVKKKYSDSGLGVDQLAMEVNMTPNYLSSLFKKETGENLSTYLKRFRMERAKELLSDTNKKIGDICVECGFVNVSYFCQSFRETFGVSPKKYREQGE